MTNNVGDALAEAEAVKDKKDAASIKKQAEGGKLPDLGKIEVVELTADDIAVQAEEAKKRQAWVQEAAEKIVVLQSTVSHLTKLSVDSPLSSAEQGTLSSSKTSIKKLRQMVEAAGYPDHLKKAILLENIRRSDPDSDNLNCFIAEVVGAGHYCAASKTESKKLNKAGADWPKGTFRYHGQIYLPCFEENKSGYQMAIEAELGKLVRKTKKHEHEAMDARLAEIQDIPIVNLVGFKSKESGVYSPYFPGGENKEAKRKWLPGAIVVRLRDQRVGRKGDQSTIKVIEVVEGVGRFSWLNEHAGKYVPFKWYSNWGEKKDKAIPETAPESVVEFAPALIRSLWTAVGFALKAQRAATEAIDTSEVGSTDTTEEKGA